MLNTNVAYVIGDRPNRQTSMQLQQTEFKQGVGELFAAPVLRGGGCTHHMCSHGSLVKFSMRTKQTWEITQAVNYWLYSSSQDLCLVAKSLIDCLEDTADGRRSLQALLDQTMQDSILPITVSFSHLSAWGLQVPEE